MRLLSTIICILPLVYSLPVQQQEVLKPNDQQQQYNIEQVPSAAFIQSTHIIDTIQENYSKIIDQVMTETIQDIKEVAQDSFMTIHQLQILGKEYCRTSVDDFIQTLDTKLKETKTQLITSSARLIKDNVKDVSASSDLMSEKLDMIINPDHLSKDIVRSSMSPDHFELVKFLIHGKKYYLMHRHEKNEAIALNAWIHSWLADIKYSLKREFDLYLQESGFIAV